MSKAQTDLLQIIRDTVDRDGIATREEITAAFTKADRGAPHTRRNRLHNALRRLVVRGIVRYSAEDQMVILTVCPKCGQPTNGS